MHYDQRSRTQFMKGFIFNAHIGIYFFDNLSEWLMYLTTKLGIKNKFIIYMYHKYATLFHHLHH